MIFITNSTFETKRLAEKLGRSLKSGDVLGLIGELGAGKTSFIQGLAAGLKISEKYYVSSPTFTIMKMYPGSLNLYHFDFYRLSEPQEFEDLGFDDYAKSEGVIAIEWADRFKDLLPRNMMIIKLEVVSEHERKIELPDELAKRMNQQDFPSLDGRG